MSNKCKIIGFPESAWPIEISGAFNHDATHKKENPKLDNNKQSSVEKLNPNDYLRQAREFLKNDDRPNQIHTLKLGAQANAKSTELWFQLGRALYFDEQYQHAVTALKVAHKLDCADPNILKALDGAKKRASPNNFDRK